MEHVCRVAEERVTKVFVGLEFGIVGVGICRETVNKVAGVLELGVVITESASLGYAYDASRVKY